MKTASSRERIVLSITLALAIAPYLIGLGASSLWDSNEAFYAETPREMIESGDYIDPSFNYRPRFNKPPLSYWVVVLSYKAFGVSELSERIPIALGAMALIAIAFTLGRIIFSFEAGLFGAIALALSPRFLMFSRRILIDVYLAMFMAAALLFFVLAEKHPERRRLFLVLMYTSIGLGVLTKGPVAILLPAAVFFIYLAAFRQLKRAREMMPGWGAVIIAVIVMPWCAAVYSEHGWLYIKSFLLLDNISRYTEAVWGPSRGPLFYLPVLLGDIFPWSLFLLPALWLHAGGAIKAIRNLWAAKGVSDRSSVESASLRAVLIIWIVVIVVFFSLSRSKEDLYILPVYPAAAALIGGLLSVYIGGELPALWQMATRWSAAFLALLLLIVGVAVLNLTAHYNLDGVKTIGAAAAAGGLTAAGLALFKKPFLTVAITAVTVITINWVFVLKTLPDFERFKPVRPFCELIKATAAPDALVGYYGFASPSMVYYLRRPIFEYYSEQDIQAVFSSGKEVYCLMTLQDYEALKGSFAAPTYILASSPVFKVKLRVVFEKTEPPQVVLISNKDGANSW